VILSRGHRAWWPGIALIVAGLLTGGCGRSNRSDQQPHLTWTLSPEHSIVGPAVLNVQLQQPSGGPISGATVKLEAHMSHAGMAPVLATATESTPGQYTVPFTFTMQGDWVLLVSTVLRDGTHVERRIDVANVRPSG
jgi:hypothetical protein